MKKNTNLLALLPSRSLRVVEHVRIRQSRQVPPHLISTTPNPLELRQAIRYAQHIAIQPILLLFLRLFLIFFLLGLSFHLLHPGRNVPKDLVYDPTNLLHVTCLHVFNSRAPSHTSVHVLLQLPTPLLPVEPAQLRLCLQYALLSESFLIHHLPSPFSL
ncbi:orotidine 5'-phosphate decarboxylase [Striga asiatica]|uniref:Orotidine 5'-phosphate decarboxylase n=1 Tax=Striga asiatica TaxID=4170 RepID=A0A5A7RL76_STRAF|nr:orotidine 5'-phosphate decarboxylase [Striga asiatica]